MTYDVNLSDGSSLQGKGKFFCPEGDVHVRRVGYKARSDARSFGRNACLIDDASEGTDHVDWSPTLSNALAAPSPVEKGDLAESWQRHRGADGVRVI